MADPTTTPDALSNQRPSPSLIPVPDYDRIQAGDRVELVTALRNIVNAVNQYITRKGV